MSDKNQIELYLRENLVGQRIEDVTLFLLNEQVYDVKDCDRQLADGGIQLQLAPRGPFTFGWDSEFELMNIAFEPCNLLCTHSELRPLHTKGDFFWSNITGKQIKDINVKWNWFEDGEGRIHVVPLYLVFEMENATKFMMGAMEFKKENGELSNFIFDQEGWIVIYFDSKDIEQIISSATYLKEP